MKTILSSTYLHIRKSRICSAHMLTFTSACPNCQLMSFIGCSSINKKPKVGQLPYHTSINPVNQIPGSVLLLYPSDSQYLFHSTSSLVHLWLSDAHLLLYPVSLQEDHPFYKGISKPNFTALLKQLYFRKQSKF